jgi:hypothetical protein
MLDVLRIGAAVGTPLSLLGLIAALCYYLYSRHLKHLEQQLQALPADERARIVDAKLTRYKIDGSKLTRNDKNRLILDEMDKRYRLARLCASLLSIVFTTCFAVAAGAYVYVGRTKLQPGELRPELLAPTLHERDLHNDWTSALAKLVPLLLATQDDTGGFGSVVGKPELYPDAWTGAQAITALAESPGDQRIDLAIARGLPWLSTHKTPEGWMRYLHKPEPASTEVTAWAGLAYLMVLERRILSNNASAQKGMLEQLQFIYAILERRQAQAGAWPSFPISFSSREKPIASRGGYATSMAMNFLVRLQKARLDHVVNGNNLSKRIDMGTTWILDEYKDEYKGWQEDETAGLHEGLGLTYLLALTEAKRAGVSKVEPDRRYRDARRAWLARWVRESREKNLSEDFLLRQSQDAFDVRGTLIDTLQFPVRIEWYPWSLLLVSYFASDTDLSAEEHQQAEQMRQDLWARIQGAVDQVTVGGTFRLAETILALGLLGSQYGWR